MRSALRSWRPAPHSPATSCSISCSSMKLSVSRRKSGATSRFSSSSFSAMLISVIVGPLVVVAWVAPATLTKAHGGLILPPDLHHSRGHYPGNLARATCIAIAAALVLSSTPFRAKTTNAAMSHNEISTAPTDPPSPRRRRILLGTGALLALSAVPLPKAWAAPSEDPILDDFLSLSRYLTGRSELDPELG